MQILTPKDFERIRELRLGKLVGPAGAKKKFKRCALPLFDC